MARKNDRIRRQVQEADYTPAFKPVVTKNYAQQLYLEAIQDYDVVLVLAVQGQVRHIWQQCMQPSNYIIVI